jgi:hypothetical protein
LLTKFGLNLITKAAMMQASNRIAVAHGKLSITCHHDVTDLDALQKAVAAAQSSDSNCTGLTLTFDISAAALQQVSAKPVDHTAAAAEVADTSYDGSKQHSAAITLALATAAGSRSAAAAASKNAHLIYLFSIFFSIDSQRRITVGQASLACVRSLA